MPRQVVSKKDLQNPPPKATPLQATSPMAQVNAQATAQLDKYRDRLIKYIPVEVVGAFLAINLLVKTAGQVGGWIHWGAFAFLLIMTPVYLWKVEKVTKRMQLAISTGAFIVWVYALPGPFADMQNWAHVSYSPLFAAVLLILYTFTVPVFEA